jgi:hypothetical protein
MQHTPLVSQVGECNNTNDSQAEPLRFLQLTRTRELGPDSATQTTRELGRRVQQYE